MIAGQQNPIFFDQKAQVIGGMARRMNHPKMHFITNSDEIAVLERLIGAEGLIRINAWSRGSAKNRHMKAVGVLNRCLQRKSRW